MIKNLSNNIKKASKMLKFSNNKQMSEIHPTTPKNLQKTLKNTQKLKKSTN